MAECTRAELEEFSSATECQWTSRSWARIPLVAQDVEYEDPIAVAEVCDKIASLSPLVSPSTIETARSHFSAAAQGRAFIVQGGDCAESFDDIKLHIVQQKVGLLQEQSQIVAKGLNLPVVTVGRLAGQYAKPRSNPWEILPDGTAIHAFRGHIINGVKLSERRPDPQRLILAHFHARATIEFMSGGHLPAAPPASGSSTPGIVDTAFENHTTPSEKGMPTHDGMEQTIFTSHEALHLPYESSVTHGRYNTSASFVWIGERTRRIDGAHIEYVRGLRNPVGVKVGPTMEGPILIKLLDTLCPDPEKQENIGRITIITRMGADHINKVLPKLIHAVKKTHHRPVWVCDPCHGNTRATTCGVKTRVVDQMVDELTRAYQTHVENGSCLGGLHLEQTGEFVTECLDDTNAGSEQSLALNYRTLCDPRLSRNQALKVVRSFIAFVREYHS